MGNSESFLIPGMRYIWKSPSGIALPLVEGSLPQYSLAFFFLTYAFTIHKITKNLIRKVHLLSFCYQRWQLRTLPINIRVPNWYKNKQEQIEISTVQKHGNHMNMTNRFDTIVVELSMMARHSLDTSVLNLH